MNLIVCPSRLFAVYLLAYVVEHGGGRKFHLTIIGNPEIPYELAQVGKSLGVHFVNVEEIFFEEYTEVIIHSYFDLDAIQSLTTRLNYESLTLYSDGMRNGLYGLFATNPRLKKLIYFGFRIIEESFRNSVGQRFSELEFEIVGFKSLEDIWRSLHSYSSCELSIQFRDTDLLLVMRYWSVPGPYYQFRRDKDIRTYIKEELSLKDPPKRVIYRSHPSFNHKIRKDELHEIFGKDVEILFWEEISNQRVEFPELHSPESLLFSTNVGPGTFFAFDSSLNLLVGLNFADTTIIWPRHDVYSRYFEFQRSSKVVKEQVTWMQTFSEAVKNGKHLFYTSSIDGSSMSEIISFFNLNAKMQDIGNLERDALTQERDALVASTIWSTTKNIRRFISWLKKYR